LFNREFIDKTSDELVPKWNEKHAVDLVAGVE
jgi:hypothetical protein